MTKDFCDRCGELMDSIGAYKHSQNFEWLEGKQRWWGAISIGRITGFKPQPFLCEGCADEIIHQFFLLHKQSVEKTANDAKAN